MFQVGYFIREHKYNFTGITFPVPSNKVKIFEKTTMFRSTYTV
jgi:hypothetical protein